MNREEVHEKETHGTSCNITGNTSADKVKAPNLFERAKEEIEAFVETIHEKMEHHSDANAHNKKDELNEDAKEDNEVKMQKIKTHKNETHGTSNDISEDTPVNKVKAPNVFERAKEEIEAIAEAFHPKKDSDNK